MPVSRASRLVASVGAAIVSCVACVHDSRDIHEVTALPEQHPATVSARSFPLCSLVGPNDHDPGVYGADLGLTVKLPNPPGSVSNRLAILFGDTWAKPTDACAYPVARADDLQAWLPARRPSMLHSGPPTGGEAAACHLLEYSLTNRADVTSWSRVRLFASDSAKPGDQPMDTGMLRAPNGVFSDGKMTYVMYGSDAVSCDTSSTCPESMLCSADPSYSGKRIGVCSGAFAQAGNSTPLYCRDGSDCPAASSCGKPPHGVCLSTRPFDVHTEKGVVAPPWYRDDPRRGIARTRTIAAAIWPDRPSDYAVVLGFRTNRFLNLAVRTVAHFDPHDPGKNDFRPGYHALLMWGRAAYAEKNGAQSLPFFLYQPLDELRGDDGPRRFHPRFFAGYEGHGAARWSEHESDAVPIYGTGAKLLTASGTRLEWTEPEFDYVNQMTVSYVAPLKRWVMLYGGDDPAFIVFDPATGKAPDPVHLQRSPGAIHLRIARDPWGREAADSPGADGWSSPEPALTRQAAAPYLACGEGGPKELPGCQKDGDPHGPLDLMSALASLSSKMTPGGLADVGAKCLAGEVAMAAQGALSGNPIGRLYGVNIIDEWTDDVSDEPAATSEHAAEIYWNASTWNPYQVVLFKTRLAIAAPRP